MLPTPTRSPLSDTLWGLPTPLIDGLLGAVIGGVLSIVGGFLATLYAVHREDRRHERDAAKVDADEKEAFAAAIRVVRYELAANVATIESYLAFGTMTHDLTNAAYESVKLTLTRHLPQELRVAVFHAYQMFPFVLGNVTFLASGASTNPTKALQVISDVRDQLAAADEGLRKHLLDVMAVAEA